MFHWRDGIYFGRDKDGGVRIIIRLDANAPVPKVDEPSNLSVNLLDRTIPASEWVSIIAFVAKDGDQFSAQGHAAAESLHG